MKNAKTPNYSAHSKPANIILPFLAMVFALMLVSAIPASEASSLQQPSVKGKVTDMYSGDAIAGVTIMVKGTSTGVRSQQDGSYTIGLPANSKVLVYSATGYQTLEVDIDGRTEIEISMSKGNSSEESDLWD